MQFKHPNVLYFLALLIIPILVHLFQLQKFVKTPFTNVTFLQKIIIENRKSSRIKKWLLLATRLLVLAAVVFAFSQPYFSDKKITQKQHYFIYLDNSLSTTAKGEKGVLLQVAIQEIIENNTNKNTFSLLTNSNFFPNLSLKELKKTLLKIKPTAKKRTLEEVLLKIEAENKTKTNTSTKNILISDFQNTYKNNFTNVTKGLTLINLKSIVKNNISVDSIWLNKNSNGNFTANVKIKNQGVAKKNIPIAIFNNQKLISKQSFSIEENTQKNIRFPIQEKQSFSGKITITFNDTFSFDNHYFFTLNFNKKTAILSIGKDANFLAKIYTPDEFNFTQTSLQNTNYNNIPKQHLIILNALTKIPQPLITALTNFSKNGGHLVFIPNSQLDIQSYNSLLKKLALGTINTYKKDTSKITDIHFNHPLLKDVFIKKIHNFQYPSAYSFYTTSFTNASAVISYQNQLPFIQEIPTKNSKNYFSTASLEKTNSNFINSPLIVPVFYAIGQQSLQYTKPYYLINQTNNIDVFTQLSKNDIITVKKGANSFIPLQQTHQNKVTLTTKNNPLEAGIYHLLKKQDTLQSIAFNYPKEESLLHFLNNDELKDNKNITTYYTVKEAFNEIEEKNKVHWLWQWFLTLAIVSLLLEILILKFFKV